MHHWNYDLTWYHGSPYRIEILLSGSTITRDIELARVFSHKPQVVSLEDEPQVQSGIPRIRHNGQQKGLLYRIDEPVHPEDVIPHPHTSMAPGLEWLTKRPLKLYLIGPVTIEPGELLNEDDIRKLMKRSTQ